MTIKRALLSVSDKTEIISFSQKLHALGIELLSTGGTAKLLQEAGLPVTEVAEYTQFPEMLDGRVKTLHPKIHGGLLAKRNVNAHMNALTEHAIPTIDLVVVNLYPFAQMIAKKDCILVQAIENIDIGGPTMLRAAAKNYSHVTVVVDPEDYIQIIDELTQNHGIISETTNFALAKKVFAHTAQYDGMISNYLSALDDQEHAPRHLFPETLNTQLIKVSDLRYGENPHQAAALYRERQPVLGSITRYTQLQGKALSFNNLADADAAWECVQSFEQTACVIIKHANPCGVAIGDTPLQAYQNAFKTDSTSAFGGIIAFNRPVDQATAQAISKQFVEVLIAPEFDSEAQAIFAEKKNIRLLQIPLSQQHSSRFDLKTVSGGVLIQTADQKNIAPNELRVVTKRQPTTEEMNDLLFAWRVAKFVKSNAIVFCKQGLTLGIGAGQMSRVDSARIASIKAQQAGLSLNQSAVASDAFFPFRDGLDVVVQAGARCIIQPGGSLRDEEVIAAADEHNIAMVLTGVRHFRH